jgi:hypothetical protein
MVVMNLGHCVWFTALYTMFVPNMFGYTCAVWLPALIVSV